MNKIVISLFILGLSFGSGPCLASCGPVLISYIVGTKKNVSKGLVAYVLFSLARMFVYIILGMLVFFLGKLALERFAGSFSKYIFMIGGSFVILMGLLMALGKRMEFRACQFLKKNIVEQDKKSLIILGLIIGLLPCAPLLAIFSYTGLVSKSWLHSLIYNFSFGIGTTVSPLILLVIFAGLIPKLFIAKKEVYGRIFNLACGSLIVFLGFQLISRAF